MKTLPKTVKTIEDAKTVIQWFENTLGGGFHPDTPIADYVNTGTGEQTYTDAEISRLQPLIDGCFDIMGDEVYDYSWELYAASQPAGTFDNE